MGQAQIAPSNTTAAPVVSSVKRVKRVSQPEVRDQATKIQAMGSGAHSAAVSQGIRAIPPDVREVEPAASDVDTAAGGQEWLPGFTTETSNQVVGHARDRKASSAAAEVVADPVRDAAVPTPKRSSGLCHTLAIPSQSAPREKPDRQEGGRG